MNHELFLKRLQELAEVKTASVPRNAAIREANEPDVVYRNGQEFEISVDHNPTLSLVVKQLKTCPNPCEDCGLIVKNRVVTKGLYSFPVKHWRRHCTACNQVWNPVTKQFDIAFRSAQPYFTTFLKKRDK